MTIIEAIKSGRAFQTKSAINNGFDWFVIDEQGRAFLGNDPSEVEFDCFDILADDWIVREE